MSASLAKFESQVRQGSRFRRPRSRGCVGSRALFFLCSRSRLWARVFRNDVLPDVHEARVDDLAVDDHHREVIGRRAHRACKRNRREIEGTKRGWLPGRYA